MSFIDNVKEAVNIVQKADNIDLYRKLLDLQKDALELMEENQVLKEKIRKLEDIENIKESLIYKDNCYFLQKDDGKTDGPFCSTCWDKDYKLIRMASVPGFTHKSYTCNACKFFTQTNEIQ